ncbi:MAG: glycoside hydrolase family 2 TIM barrel-domain containing protein, partial [bacterium]
MKKLAIAVMITGLAFPAMTRAVPRPEHPRPDFQREAWQNLNGKWEFAFDGKEQGLDEDWQDKNALPKEITVPYPVESELSGIHNTSPPNVVWYKKRFNLEDDLQGNGRVLLHFGAVDYKARVWLNGRELGSHVGGYTPFTFDVSDEVKPKDNVLTVRVYDSLDRMQVRGKQSPQGKSYGIMYTTVSGIWQTVWIEKTGMTYLEDFRFTPSPELDGGRFDLDIKGGGADAELRISGPGVDETVRWNGKPVNWKNKNVKPWSPSSPVLYQLEIKVQNQEGKVIDKVKSYIGVRTIEARNGKIYLNGEPFYQKLLLDQGYFPGGVYTPKTDEIMRSDVNMYKRMGFNGLRKHQKVEDPRFLYWCDVEGLVVWEEMPSLGFGIPGYVPDWAMERFEKEWMDVMDRDYNHPSIIVWTVYNESWGIYEMLWRKEVRDWGYRMVQRTREADPSRLTVDNSGGFHFDTDIWDFHHYLPTVEDSRELYEKYDFESGDHLGFSY